MKKIFILILLLLAIESYCSMIKGHVYDEKKQPLFGANVLIDSLLMGAASDEDGYYFITALKPGKYDLKCQYLGYQTKYFNNVEITDKDQVLKLNITLKSSAIKLEEILFEDLKEDLKTSLDMRYRYAPIYLKRVTKVKIFPYQFDPFDESSLDPSFWEKIRWFFYDLFN